MAVVEDLAKDDLIEFRDIDYRGYSSNPGSLFFLSREYAIQNTIKMYLMSQAGDYGRDVGKGGPLFSLIGKAVTTPEELDNKIREALTIYTNIEVIQVTSSFISDDRRWVITLQFRDTLNKIETLTSFGIQQ